MRKKMWSVMTASVLAGAMVLSQQFAVFASDSVEIAAGGEEIVEESAMPQQGAGIGLSVPAGGGAKREDIAGSIALGAGADLGSFDTQADTASFDTDTVMLDDIQLTLKVQGSYILMDAEDEYFHYIYTWGSQGIPDIMVGAFNWDTTDGFFDAYFDYLSGARPDLTVAEGPADMTLGNKNLQKVVYNYGVQGYNVRDTRYIWLGPNSTLYMFTKREIPDIEYTLGNTLEDIIQTAAVMGYEDTQPAPVPETNAPQPEVTVPQPETAAPAPQPETTAAPAGQGDLYTMNEDSSWTVTTDYYTMTIPPAWTGHFDASILTMYGEGYNLEVVNKESADAGFGGHLFTVMLVPLSEDFTTFPSYDYLGTMDTPEGTFSVVIRYPTDVQSGDVWQEFYKILNGDKNSAITTIRPAAGVTWTLPDGQTIAGDAGSGAPQAETTAPQPETSVLQPETTAPQPQTTGGMDVVGVTSGNTYTNSSMRFGFTIPAGWIMASQDQLAQLNQGIGADQFQSSIDSGIPVCVAYAQSANGMEVMNVVLENAASFMDPGVTQITQEEIRTILTEASSVSISSLENLGGAVTGSAVNSVNCMGQTCPSLDITFNYSGFSGTQKQFCIPVGTYLAMVTVRSVSGDNTQAMVDMFSAA